MIPWYWFLARPVMRMEGKGTWEQTVTSWRGPAYLTGLIALFAVALYANPNAWFLAFAFSPQCFQVVSVRRAMAFVIVLNAVAGLMLVLPRPSVENAATAAATILFAVGFTWVFSRWTVRVIEQSHERAALLAQLEAAQEELAEVNHEAGALAERQRLAAEIHDTLAQGFLSIVTLIQAAQGDPGCRRPGQRAPGTRAGHRPGEPGRGPGADRGASPGQPGRRRSARCGSPGGRGGRPGRGDRGDLRRRRSGAPAAHRHRGRAAPGVPGSAGQRAQARRATRAEVRLSYTAAAVAVSVADGTLSVTTAPGAGTTVRAEIPA